TPAPSGLNTAVGQAPSFVRIEICSRLMLFLPSQQSTPCRVSGAASDASFRACGGRQVDAELSALVALDWGWTDVSVWTPCPHRSPSGSPRARRPLRGLTGRTEWSGSLSRPRTEEERSVGQLRRTVLHRGVGSRALGPLLHRDHGPQ